MHSSVKHYSSSCQALFQFLSTPPIPNATHPKRHPSQLELDVLIDLIQFVEAQQALAVLQVPKPQSKLSSLANEMGLLVEGKRRQLQGVSNNVKAHMQLLGRLRDVCSTYVQHVGALQVWMFLDMPPMQALTYVLSICVCR